MSKFELACDYFIAISGIILAVLQLIEGDSTGSVASLALAGVARLEIKMNKRG